MDQKIAKKTWKRTLKEASIRVLHANDAGALIKHMADIYSLWYCISRRCVEKRQLKRAVILRKRFVRFLLVCHQRKQHSKAKYNTDSPKEIFPYEGLVGAYLALYIDVVLLSNDMSSIDKQVNIIQSLLLFLGKWPEKIVDAFLGVTVKNDNDRGSIFRNLIWRFTEEAREKLLELQPSHYIKWAILIKRWSPYIEQFDANETWGFLWTIQMPTKFMDYVRARLPAEFEYWCSKKKNKRTAVKLTLKNLAPKSERHLLKKMDISFKRASRLLVPRGELRKQKITNRKLAVRETTNRDRSTSASNDSQSESEISEVEACEAAAAAADYRIATADRISAEKIASSLDEVFRHVETIDAKDGDEDGDADNDNAEDENAEEPEKEAACEEVIDGGGDGDDLVDAKESQEPSNNEPDTISADTSKSSVEEIPCRDVSDREEEEVEEESSNDFDAERNENGRDNEIKNSKVRLSPSPEQHLRSSGVPFEQEMLLTEQTCNEIKSNHTYITLSNDSDSEKSSDAGDRTHAENGECNQTRSPGELQNKSNVYLFETPEDPNAKQERRSLSMLNTSNNSDDNNNGSSDGNSNKCLPECSVYIHRQSLKTYGKRTRRAAQLDQPTHENGSATNGDSPKSMPTEDHITEPSNSAAKKKSPAAHGTMSRTTPKQNKKYHLRAASAIKSTPEQKKEYYLRTGSERKCYNLRATKSAKKYA